ncbi:MAG: hypothetical protein AAGD09_03570 [Cyanobacteria bacterium P01_F01_bin.56]
MRNIRGKISDRHGEMLESIKQSTGIDQTVAILEHLITNAYYQHCFSDSIEDVKIKATLVLFRVKKLSLEPKEVERVSFSDRAVQVWTTKSGEPYVVAVSQWR